MKTILLFCFCLAFLATTVCFADKDAVLLKDIQVLTFTKGEYTQGRRHSGVPQLRCTGGGAKGKYEPYTVMCRNMGYDGVDVAWKCEADIPSEYSLGKVTVNCEGYNYPTDSYVLKDSCGLEYNLEYSETGRQQPRANYPRHDTYVKDRDTYARDRGFISNVFHTITGWITSIIMLPVNIVRWFISFLYSGTTTFLKLLTAGIALLVAYSIFRGVTSNRHENTYAKRSDRVPVYGAAQGGLAGGSKEGHKGPGFISGLVSGGVLSYLFNRRKNEQLYQRDDGTWSRVPADRPANAPPPPPDTHESVAYGTTKRR